MGSLAPHNTINLGKVDSKSCLYVDIIIHLMLRDFCIWCNPLDHQRSLTLNYAFFQKIWWDISYPWPQTLRLMHWWLTLVCSYHIFHERRWMSPSSQFFFVLVPNTAPIPVWSLSNFLLYMSTWTWQPMSILVYFSAIVCVLPLLPLVSSGWLSTSSDGVFSCLYDPMLLFDYTCILYMYPLIGRVRADITFSHCLYVYIYVSPIFSSFVVFFGCRLNFI